MAEHLLRNRDYTIILARHTVTADHAPPDLAHQWEVAEQSLSTIFHKSHEFDHDGITIYIASSPPQKLEHQCSDDLTQVLAQGYSTETLDLAQTLEIAIADYFGRKTQQQTQPNGEIIVVVLDSEPPNRRAVIKSLVKATQGMDSQEELGIMFAQVGTDALTTGFLMSLDDNLHRANAEHNIADTVILAEMAEEEIPKFFLNALYG